MNLLKKISRNNLIRLIHMLCMLILLRLNLYLFDHHKEIDNYFFSNVNISFLGEPLSCSVLFIGAISLFSLLYFELHNRRMKAQEVKQAHMNEGAYVKSKVIAKSLKNQGVDINIISSATGLFHAEIYKL